MPNSSTKKNRFKHFIQEIVVLISNEVVIEEDFLKKIFGKIKQEIYSLHEKQIDSLENLIYSKTKYAYQRLEVSRRFRILRSIKSKKGKDPKIGNSIKKSRKRKIVDKKIISRELPMTEHEGMIEVWKRTNEERKEKLKNTHEYELGISHSESDEDPIHRK